jgi:hypothetical protein
MARILVIHELGHPISSVARGNTEIMTYPKGVRITLKAGKVTEVVGLKPAEAAATAVEPAAEPAAEAPEPALTKEQAQELARMEKQQAAADAKARAELEKSLTDLENMHSQPATHLLPPPFDFLSFGIGLAVKWVLTLAALKLSCKYWGSDVFWTGLMLVALVDVLVRGIVGLIGFKLLHMMSLFYADEALAGLAMVLVLRKVSINQRLALAVEITLTTKTFSIVVGSFLVTILLHALA